MSRIVTDLVFRGRTINDVWEEMYKEISRQAEESFETAESRDGAVVGEILNAVAIVEDPTRNILTSQIRKMPMRYAIGEFLWYLSGNPTLQAIGNYTNAWERMSDDGETVNSNYGYIIQNCKDSTGLLWEDSFNQFEYCYELLRDTPNTRQAIIHIKTPRDTRKNPTKDLNCTVYCQFFVREDYVSVDIGEPVEGKQQAQLKKVPKLYMSTHMRSNDLWMGVPYDMFFFMNLQVLMAMKLGVGIGSYTHYAGSLHMYERDYATSKANLEKFSL